jgi:Domain of unknown function (DUF222)
LATRLNISKQDAKRRVKQAELLGPRTALTGEALPPQLPNVAAAQERGEIGPEHVRIVEKFFDELPSRIDSQTRELAEADLARIATGLGPRNCARPPTGWRCYSTRTARNPMTPSGSAAAISLSTSRVSMG